MFTKVENKGYRPALPLHSSLYEALSAPLSVVILDESHIAKNADSQLSHAVRSLAYEHLFLLSGTPIHNQWHDGQMALLPGCILQDETHFHKVFHDLAKTPSTGEKGGKSRLLRPGSIHTSFMRRLLAPIIIARPKSVLERGMPAIHESTIMVDLSEHIGLCQRISKDVKTAKFLMAKLGRIGGGASSPLPRPEPGSAPDPCGGRFQEGRVVT